MNREIEYIQTVITTAVLTASGTWTYTGATPPAAHECVIRQVTYGSAAPNNGVFVINSNLNNGPLAVFCSTAGFNTAPGTRIQIRTPIAGQLTFSITDW